MKSLCPFAARAFRFFPVLFVATIALAGCGGGGGDDNTAFVRGGGAGGAVSYANRSYVFTPVLLISRPPVGGKTAAFALRTDENGGATATLFVTGGHYEGESGVYADTSLFGVCDARTGAVRIEGSIPIGARVGGVTYPVSVEITGALPLSPGTTVGGTLVCRIDDEPYTLQVGAPYVAPPLPKGARYEAFVGEITNARGANIAASGKVTILGQGGFFVSQNDFAPFEVSASLTDTPFPPPGVLSRSLSLGGVKAFPGAERMYTLADENGGYAEISADANGKQTIKRFIAVSGKVKLVKLFGEEAVLRVENATFIAVPGTAASGSFTLNGTLATKRAYRR